MTVIRALRSRLRRVLSALLSDDACPPLESGRLRVATVGDDPPVVASAKLAVEPRARDAPPLQTFTGPGTVQDDDITMVTLQRAARVADVSPSLGGGVLADFDVPSAPGNERQAIERVEHAVAGLGLDSARLERLKTAVAEATMNAMEHGNEYRAERPVSIRVLHREGRVRVQISDRGDAGELLQTEAPDLQAKLEGRQRPRGWGLFLIEQMVDEARVTSDGGGRTVELVVHLEEGADDRE